MDIGKTFGTSKELETEGQWVPLDDTGCRIKILRSNCPEARALHFKEMQKIKHLTRTVGQPYFDAMRRIGLKILSEVTVANWENVEMDGKPLPYSKDNAKKLFERYPDFADMVASLTETADVFKSEELELEAKNSVTTSAGN